MSARERELLSWSGLQEERGRTPDHSNCCLFEECSVSLIGALLITLRYQVDTVHVQRSGAPSWVGNPSAARWGVQRAAYLLPPHVCELADTFKTHDILPFSYITQEMNKQ